MFQNEIKPPTNHDLGILDIFFAGFEYSDPHNTHLIHISQFILYK